MAKQDYKGNRVSNVPTKKHAHEDKVTGGVFVYNGNISASELSKELNIPAAEIIKFLFLSGKMITINQTLNDDTIGTICLHFGFDFKKEKNVAEENFEELEITDDPKNLVERPPVVTVMGHVDHGKTTLIDAIRSSHIVDTEHGGISQAIGAYQKEYNGKKITFIDTPGHEAFTAMRSRGASVTDIIILVVAADDGVMPQTVEAINHARAANVPILVAINKIDKPGANPQRVKDELMKYDIIPEEYGGKNIFLEISAKKKIGIDDLLENILVLSEMLELKANPNRFAYGTVLEAKLDKGEGPKATFLVQNGTLKSSDYVVAGVSYGKIRRMSNEYNKVVKQALPSTPVSVIGLSELPLAGDHFMAFSNEKQAREIAAKRKLIKEQNEMRANNSITLDELYNRINEGAQSINVIVKADNTGSAEALKSNLEKIDVKGAKVRVLASNAGAINESDVLLASASNAIIYGFNVRPSTLIKEKAKEQKVEIRLYSIIYKLIEEMEAAMKGLLKAELVEQVTGQAEVRALYKVSKIGTIAGCYVTEGIIKSMQSIRLIRDGVVVYEGKINSLKRFKDDAKEVKTGFECGITIENYNDLKEGDIIEGYEMVEKQ
jgi:translation initiation factor IF-2